MIEDLKQEIARVEKRYAEACYNGTTAMQVGVGLELSTLKKALELVLFNQSNRYVFSVRRNGKKIRGGTVSADSMEGALIKLTKIHGYERHTIGDFVCWTMNIDGFWEPISIAIWA